MHRFFHGCISQLYSEVHQYQACVLLLTNEAGVGIEEEEKLAWIYIHKIEIRLLALFQMRENILLYVVESGVPSYKQLEFIHEHVPS